jgi:hypothetical protein
VQRASSAPLMNELPERINVSSMVTSVRPAVSRAPSRSRSLRVQPASHAHARDRSASDSRRDAVTTTKIPFLLPQNLGETCNPDTPPLVYDMQVGIIGQIQGGPALVARSDDAFLTDIQSIKTRWVGRRRPSHAFEPTRQRRWRRPWALRVHSAVRSAASSRRRCGGAPDVSRVRA